MFAYKDRNGLETFDPESKRLKAIFRERYAFHARVPYDLVARVDDRNFPRMAFT